MRANREFYTVDEVAGLLDLHVRTIRRFIRDGKLAAVRIGKQYRIPARDLDAFVGRAREPRRPEVERRPRTFVATTADIDAIGAEDARRATAALTAAFGSGHAPSAGTELDCDHDEKRGRLRIVVAADLAATTAILGMLNGLIGDPRR